MKTRMAIPRAPVLVALIALTIRPGGAWAWGEPHAIITRAALATLPEWQKQTLGEEWAALGSQHCLIPDRVFADRDLAKYATMDTRTGGVYLVNLHLPGNQVENYDVLRYFTGKAVDALRVGNMRDAARYAGTLAHALEDWSCPAHAAPGDNMFTLFKQFLPPPAAWKYPPLHGPIESGSFPLDIAPREPAALGDSVDEAAFHLLHMANEAIIAARAEIVPIIQGLYASDTNTVTEARRRAAARGAGLVADALNAVFLLGAQDDKIRRAPAPATVDLAARVPLEATNLAFPQGAFFSKPYWGHAQRNVTLRDGTNAVPLKLVIEEGGTLAEKQFAVGIGTGTRSSLTYLVPTGVYERFTTLVGLQAGMGTAGDVQFAVLGNGKELCAARITGGQPAKFLDCPLAGITNLQLLATSGGGGAGNYAVWAEPRLIKSGPAPGPER